MTEEKPRSVKKRTITAGWICFVIGMFLMFASLGTFFLYGPLFLAAFILSIVGMAQGRVAAGIVLLLVSLAIPTISWVGLIGYKVCETLTEQKKLKHEALSKIDFEDVEGYIDGSYMYCKGRIRNNGESTVNFGVEWLDENGKVLDTDWTYAVSVEELHPGVAKSFKILTPADKRMKMFRYFIMRD